MRRTPMLSWHYQPAKGTIMATITTRVAGLPITAIREGDTWVGTILPDVPVMERPFDLRSTYESPDLRPVLYAMMVDADVEVNGTFI